MRAKDRTLVLKILTIEHSALRATRGQIPAPAPTSVREDLLGTASYSVFLWKALFEESVLQF